MINFNPETHSYIDETGGKYVSVTTLLKKYSNEFDPTGEITKRYALKHGLTVEQVLANWKEIADQSLTRGKTIHRVIEDYFNTGVYDYEHKRLIEQVKWLKITGKKKPEVMLHNTEYKLVGIADLIVENKNRFDIYDYKTNKKFNFCNQYNEKLKYPLDHLDDCEYNKYAMQLSMYAYMLGNVRQLGIIWINHDTEVKYIPVPFMKHEVEILLKHYANKTNRA